MGFWKDVGKRIIGTYEPGDPFRDLEDDFADPAEVKKRRGKKNNEPETIPWGPLVPAGADLLFEIPRPGQSDPDLYTVSDYREKIWRESGKSPSADIGTIIQGRIKSGDIGFRLYLLNSDGKAAGPAPEELSNAFIELYNKLYKEALDKLAEELAKRKEQSKKAAAKIAADKEAADKNPQEAAAELVEDLVNQAKTMTFEQKRDLIAMLPSLSEAVRAKIISARPDDPEPNPPAGDTGSPVDPPPASGGDGTAT